MIKKATIALAVMSAASNIHASDDTPGRLQGLINSYLNKPSGELAYKIGLLYTTPEHLNYQQARFYLERSAERGFARAHLVINGLPTNSSRSSHESISGKPKLFISAGDTVVFSKSNFDSNESADLSNLNRYIVEKGDTLSKIAQRLGGTNKNFHARLKLIKELNSSLFTNRSFDDLRIGERLLLPSNSYLVSQSIANERAYGSDSNEANINVSFNESKETSDNLSKSIPEIEETVSIEREPLNINEIMALIDQANAELEDYVTGSTSGQALPPSAKDMDRAMKAIKKTESLISKFSDSINPIETKIVGGL